MKRLAQVAATLAASLVLGAAPGPLFAGSQLFKCVDGGRTVYQQQACPVSAVAEAPASAVKADPASVAAARKLRPGSASASAAPATPR